MHRFFAADRGLLAIISFALALYANQAAADWRAGLPQARLVGEAEFRWYGFDLYQARLFSAVPTPSLVTPFALELVYRRTIPRQALVETSLEQMQRVSDTPIGAEQLDAWAAQMRRAFVDVKPGTRITGVNLPGNGARFYVDGRLSHEVSDPLFARHFFAIWLDPRTREPEMRQRLLGLDPTRGRRSTP